MTLRFTLSISVLLVFVAIGIYVLATQKVVDPSFPPEKRVYIGRYSRRHALVAVTLWFPAILYAAWLIAFVVVMLGRMLLGVGAPGDVPINRAYLLMMAVLVIPTAVFFTRWVYDKLRWTTIDDGRHCLNCAYNLTGNTSGGCPECGAPIEKTGQSDKP